jgi:hypothetical protein
MPAATVPPAKGKDPFPAVDAEFGGGEASRLQQNRELVSAVPALGVLLGCRYHLSLQTPSLTPSLESNHVDAQLF